MSESPKIIDDGGPAFPGEARYVEGAGMVTVHGMTMRDWFAGQALAGMCANATGLVAIRKVAEEQGKEAGRTTASYCYGMADAMLARRKAAGR